MLNRLKWNHTYEPMNLNRMKLFSYRYRFPVDMLFETLNVLDISEKHKRTQDNAIRKKEAWFLSGSCV